MIFYLNKLLKRGDSCFFFCSQKILGRVVLFQCVCGEGKASLCDYRGGLRAVLFFLCILSLCGGGVWFLRPSLILGLNLLFGEGSTMKGGSYYKILKRDKAKAVILQSVGC
jgi:hypothetical protein